MAKKGRSKIDRLGVGARVLTLRKTLTCEETADIINKTLLPAGEEPIDKVAVSRYCTSHGMLDHERNDLRSMRFDALDEANKVRNRLIHHVNKLERLMNDLKEDQEKLSELSSISNAYLNSMKLLQELNESVSKIQAEQLKVDKVRTCLRTLIEVLNKYPIVKADYFEKLQESDNFDMIRSL